MHDCPGIPWDAAPDAAPMLRPIELSARAEALQPSLTLAIAARAKALRADGHDICSLSAGEPDFDTPAFIRQAATAALEAGHTRYGPAAGEPALRGQQPGAALLQRAQRALDPDARFLRFD